MARWLIKLDGENADLDEYPYWFPDGRVFALEEGGNVYLTGPAFESHKSASQVHGMALGVVDEFSAVISLLSPAHRRPEVAEVIREVDDGRRETTVFLSSGFSIRSKTRATFVVEGQTFRKPSPTQGQELLAGAFADDHLRMALVLWGDRLRTWPRLYRVLEEVERYLGQDANKEGFCSAKRRERFTRSANSAEVAGKDARHATGKYRAPKNPMDLSEAIRFVGGVLQQALHKAAAGNRG